MNSYSNRMRGSCSFLHDRESKKDEEKWHLNTYEKMLHQLLNVEKNGFVLFGSTPFLQKQANDQMRHPQMTR